MKVWFPVVKGNSGTDIFTIRLASALEKKGVKTEVSWFPAAYQFCPFLMKNIPAPKGTDVIHANTWNGFAFKRTGTPLVVTEHHSVFSPEYERWKSTSQRLYHGAAIRRYINASLSVASGITAVSERTAADLRKTTDYSADRVIYNFVDLDQFSPDPSACRPTGPFRLLFVGNLTARKGADMLVPLMQALGPSFQLRFTSGLRSGRLTNTTENMVPLGHLSDHRDLIKEYQSCDAVVFPTRFEGFGYVALEAMACGKPVIASNNSAVPEVVDDGATGILCPTGDIESFAAACRYLAWNPEIAQGYGNAGRQRAMTLFSEKVIIPQYIAFYEFLGGQ